MSGTRLLRLRLRTRTGVVVIAVVADALPALLEHVEAAQQMRVRRAVLAVRRTDVFRQLRTRAQLVVEQVIHGAVDGDVVGSFSVWVKTIVKKSVKVRILMLHYACAWKWSPLFVRRVPSVGLSALRDDDRRLRRISVSVSRSRCRGSYGSALASRLRTGLLLFVLLEHADELVPLSSVGVADALVIHCAVMFGLLCICFAFDIFSLSGRW